MFRTNKIISYSCSFYIWYSKLFLDDKYKVNTAMTRLSHRGLICLKRFCGWGLIRGELFREEGLLNLEVFRFTKDNISFNFSI